MTKTAKTIDVVKFGGGTIEVIEMHPRRPCDGKPKAVYDVVVYDPARVVLSKTGYAAKSHALSVAWGMMPGLELSLDLTTPTGE